MKRHPLVHHLLPQCVPGQIAGSLIGALPVANANIIVKTAKGFEGDLTGHTHVSLGVEVHGTPIGHDLAAAFRWRRIDDGPSIRIAKELEGHLIPPLVERLPLGCLYGRSLRVIRALELVIARGVLKELVNRWRVVVHRRELDLDDAMVRVRPELWTELQPRDAIVVDVYEVQPRKRNSNLHALLRMAIAAAQ